MSWDVLSGLGGVKAAKGSESEMRQCGKRPRVAKVIQKGRIEAKTGQRTQKADHWAGGKGSPDLKGGTASPAPKVQ